MKEQIGRITLDYKHYSGKDLYCDGAIEDEILAIVENHPEEEYPRIIEERANWPILYHLSPLRENIVDWIPIDSSMKVLEVGSGCGAITGALARKAGTVTCIDLSKKRSLINAYRHKDCDNVTIHVGNFKDIEPQIPTDYDYIFLIGVFEYGQAYMGTDTPYEDFMAIIKKHMGSNGRMVIAIENKFGLKYWAGCKEDHFGTFFSGIEDYPDGGGVRTFTRRGLEKIMRANNVDNYSFYYPYPDYKFMTTVYSDAYLPQVGELSNNLRNFDRDRMMLFDEKNAFDAILREGMFDQYSNSYLLVIGEPLDIKYAKFSNDRAEKFSIRTDIWQDAAGNRTVYKTPIGKKAREHIENIETVYEKLKMRYSGSRFHINKCQLEDGRLQLEYVNGKTLEMLLDQCLDQGDETGFRKLIDEFAEAVQYNENMSINDYDLIFSNILVDENTNKWTILDYEWTFTTKIPFEQNIARALYCYLIGANKRRKISFQLLREKCGIEENEINSFVDKEIEFQRYVTGQRLSMTELRDKIGQAMIPVQQVALCHAENWRSKKVQIYEDRGNGFSEADSYVVSGAYGVDDGKNEGHAIETTICCKEDVQSLRIDPALESCIVKVNALSVNGRDIWNKKRTCQINGKKIGSHIVVFGTTDPNIVVDFSGEIKEKKEIKISLEVVSMPTDMAEIVEQGLTKRTLF